MKKIMFNDRYGLTKAVLEGRKTQTRRIAYDGDIEKPRVGYGLHNAEEDKCILHDNWMQVAISHYKIGEEVAIAQSYDDIYMEKNAPCPIPDEYRLNAYNKGFNQGHKGWKNKMFVSADDMPFRIKITNIRIERLQDISEDDCLNEGLEWAHGLFYVNYNKETGSRINLGNDYRNAFATLIDKISGKGTWESNPWVFVYDFELIK